MGKVSVSITIPAFNEEATIVAVFQQAKAVVSRITNNYEIVLVNDGSTDRTGAIMDRLKKRHARHVEVVHHRSNRGFSGAMKSCYNSATKELIFLGPADGQFDYRELPLFVRVIHNRDIVVAYRSHNQERWYRKFNSFIFHGLMRTLLGIRLRELSSCIMYRKHVRDAVAISADDFSCLFLPELIYKSMKKRYNIGQVPIHFYRRAGGSQKGTNPKMILRTVTEIIRFWFDMNIRLRAIPHV